MKAEVVQQLSLLELASVDAELGRLAHRATHLAEQERFEAVQAEHREANDRLAVLSIALEDLDGQVNKFESEVDAVRQREDRDRSLLAGGNTDPKQLVELQHELETLERRQASLGIARSKVFTTIRRLVTTEFGAVDGIPPRRYDECRIAHVCGNLR